MTFTSVGKNSGEGVIGMETQAWNIADGFTKIKILRILIELDLYETIAMFGKQDMSEPVDTGEMPYRRVEGFDRMLFSLKQLVSNCKFAIKKEEDKKILNSFIERLNEVEKVRSGISMEIKNDLTKEVDMMINEEHFMKCLNVLRVIKGDLNTVLNQAGLIFKSGDELNLDDFMRSLEEGE
jgi:hypothetical protein